MPYGFLKLDKDLKLFRSFNLSTNFDVLLDNFYFPNFELCPTISVTPNFSSFHCICLLLDFLCFLDLNLSFKTLSYLLHKLCFYMMRNISILFNILNLLPIRTMLTIFLFFVLLLGHEVCLKGLDFFFLFVRVSHSA